MLLSDPPGALYILAANNSDRVMRARSAHPHTGTSSMKSLVVVTGSMASSLLIACSGGSRAPTAATPDAPTPADLPACATVEHTVCLTGTWLRVNSDSPQPETLFVFQLNGQGASGADHIFAALSSNSPQGTINADIQDGGNLLGSLMFPPEFDTPTFGFTGTFSADQKQIDAQATFHGRPGLDFSFVRLP
jgi:hypothetical protein